MLNLFDLLKNRIVTIFTLRFWGTERVNRWNHFQDSEVAGLDMALIAMLDIAREKAGCPFVITSGLRTLEQNARLSEAVHDSAHLTGNAVDLSCPDSSTRFHMMQGLLFVGFKRLGIYSAHIHADNSKVLPQEVLWYISGT